MSVNVHVIKHKRITPSKILDMAEVTGDRYVLADRNLVIMNIDDYEDMLFMSNRKIQKEITRDMEEYEKTGGVDYLKYRKKRMRKGATDVPR